MDSKQIGARIRTMRLAAKLTQQELSDRSGVSLMQINRYEKGRVLPSLDNVLAIAAALNLSLDYLVAATDDPRGKLSDSNLSASERRLFAAVQRRDIPAMLREVTDMADDVYKQGVTGIDEGTLDKGAGGGRKRTNPSNE